MVAKDNVVGREYRPPDLDYSGFSVNEDDITVVIPVLNEEAAIGSVIQSVKNEGYGKILVVDGYSTDGTVSIANGKGVKVIYQSGVGKTGAIKTAVEHVETPYFVVMDGDCTYDPKDIRNFFPYLRSSYEVIGVRTFGRQNIPLLNRFGNWVINATFNLLFGSNILDVCSGMYALRSDFSRSLFFDTRGFDVEVEIASQSAMEGRLTQVPINYYSRVGMQKLKPFRNGLQIFSSIYRLALRYNPAVLYSILASINLIPAVIMLLWVLLEGLKGVWHIEFAILGLILFITGLSALITCSISILIKRMELRLKRQIQNGVH